MSKRLKITALKPPQKDECCHYWVIGQPQKGVSNGVCKFCGMTKGFKGYGLWTKGDTSLELDIKTA
jgi:hypothetical protein